jgi:hypothetical protein
MKRREFIQAAAVLTSGAAVLPPGWAMNHEQRVFLAAQPAYIERRQPDFFSPAQRAAVSAAAEQVIPQTDTPGAADAGVPRFIELMVSDWFDEAERGLFMDGLADLQQRAAGDFAGLPTARQLALLEQLEDEAGDHDWYNIGNVSRVWDSQAPFICQLKELTVLGFMLSEVGATQFLRPNPMGVFDGAVPLAGHDPSHASELPLRLIDKE